jgi:hypothetical protein
VTPRMTTRSTILREGIELGIKLKNHSKIGKPWHWNTACLDRLPCQEWVVGHVDFLSIRGDVHAVGTYSRPVAMRAIGFWWGTHRPPRRGCFSNEKDCFSNGVECASGRGYFVCLGSTSQAYLRPYKLHAGSRAASARQVVIAAQQLRMAGYLLPREESIYLHKVSALRHWFVRR